MKFIATLAVLVASAGIAAAQAPTTKDNATANEKPGQGTNTGVNKDGKMMGEPLPTESSSGTSTGTAGQPGANGKGVTPNSNSGPTKK